MSGVFDWCLVAGNDGMANQPQDITTMPEDIRIQVASTEHAVEASKLLHLSITELCEPDYRDVPGFIEQWLENKTPETLSKWIEHPTNEFLIAPTEQGQLMGIGCLGKNGEILLCYVHPDYIKTGVGKALLTAMLDTAKGWNLKHVTAYSTRTAKNFYLAQGFVDTLVQEYENGVAVEFKLEKYL